MLSTRTCNLWVSASILGICLVTAWPVSADDVPVLPKSVVTTTEAPQPTLVPTPLPAPQQLPDDRRSQKRRAKEVTPDQEQRILAFVAVQHPELSVLLQRLREKDSQQYQVALHDLRATVEKLTRLQTKNPKRYDAELESWKVQSRIRLLRARRALQPDGVPESELRTWLDREVETRLQLLKLTRAEQAARLAQLDEEIRSTEVNRSEDVDREVKRAMKKSKARPTSPRTKPSTRRKASPTPATPELGDPE